MTAEERSERIERYASGQMTGAEAVAFETEMAADSAMAEEVALERDLLESLTETDVHTFRATLADVRRQKREARIIPLASRRRWALAASFLVLVIAGYFVVDSVRTPSPESLYQAYFKAPEAEEFMAPVTFQSRTDEKTADFTPEEQALRHVAELYRNRQHAEALATMRAIEPSDEEAHAYQLGVLYLVNGQAEAALEQLARGEGANPDGAWWYQAMALLELDRPMEARARLERLVESSSPWRAQAKKLLRRLK